MAAKNTNRKKPAGRKAAETGRSSLLRQLMGAVVGGSLALSLYYVYEYGAPVVTAWLTVPQAQNTVEGGVAARSDLKEEEQDRIASRARFLVDLFGQENDPPPPKKGVPENWDLDAIANLEQAADEGWGGYADEWPEPPQEPPEHEAADEWDAAWDDTWDDDFANLAGLSYDEMEAELAGADDWDDTWDESYWEDRSLTASVASADAAVRPVMESTASADTPVRSHRTAPEPEHNAGMKAEVAQASHAPSLPSSGVGVGLATLLTAAGTAGLQRKRLLRIVRGS